MAILTKAQKDFVDKLEAGNRHERRATGAKMKLSAKIPGSNKPYVKKI